MHAWVVESFKFFSCKELRQEETPKEIKGEEENTKKRGSDAGKIFRELDNVTTNAAAATSEVYCFTSFVNLSMCYFV